LYPTESPPGVPISAPLVHLVPRPSSLPLGKNTTLIPSVAPLIENYDSDSDDNVSFAECLFPVTPPGEVLLGRSLSNEGLMSDDDVFSSSADFLLGPPLGSKKSPLVFDLRKQLENGRRSVDLAMIKNSWSSKDIENGRRSVDVAMIKKSWPLQDVENRTRSVDMTRSKMSWASQDVEGFSDSSINRRSSFEYNKDATIEGRRAIFEASYKQVWVPNGLERGATRSWTSSSLLEEGIDSGPALFPPYEDAEDDFLEEFEGYFSSLEVDNVRRTQYPNLELQKIVYLDYANFSLFSNFQVRLYIIYL
jgi:molybdenum cofactor sulfurtransferase